MSTTRAQELERERDELRAAAEKWLKQRNAAFEREERLLALLEDLRKRIEVMGNGEQSDSVRVHNRLLNQSEDALTVIVTTLAALQTPVQPREPSLEPDFTHKCEACGATPVMPLTGMCGPCTTGEASTAGGKW